MKCQKRRYLVFGRRILPKYELQHCTSNSVFWLADAAKKRSYSVAEGGSCQKKELLGFRQADPASQILPKTELLGFRKADLANNLANNGAQKINAFYYVFSHLFFGPQMLFRQLFSGPKK